mgnify:CR=1 FL=1
MEHKLPDSRVKSMTKIRTRYAPSPTGKMHVGNLRTALYAYLIAKHEGGDFILRIEDTDQERFVEGATEIIYNTMRDTGLKHDEGPDIGGPVGPYVQSDRQKQGIYMEYAKKLIDKGEAYYCFCDQERLNSLKREVNGEEIMTYDKHCLHLSKEEVEANLKGADSDADIAVLAVKLSDIPEDTLNAISVATIDNSDDVKVGQGVMAIGNALGLGQTTTFGHVSALNKDVTTSDDNVTRSMMQIDAAINAGNSGGGLFDANGHLIGINSAKSSGEGVEGMGYAIPISSVEDLINNMMNQKTKVQIDEDQRGYLGIQGVDVPTEYVQRFGMPEGAMVTKITEGSPASDAGLQLNDIITAVDGQKVSSFETLRSALSYYAAGESVTITVQRPNGNQYTETQITVTLADRSTITDTTEADTEEGSSEAETQEPQVQMQKAQ